MHPLARLVEEKRSPGLLRQATAPARRLVDDGHEGHPRAIAHGLARRRLGGRVAPPSGLADDDRVHDPSSAGAPMRYGHAASARRSVARYRSPMPASLWDK